MLIPLDGKEPFHSAAEVSTALYGYEEGKPEEAVPSFRRTAAGNVLEVYCESALMTKDNCVGMMTGVTVRNFDDQELLPLDTPAPAMPRRTTRKIATWYTNMSLVRAPARGDGRVGLLRPQDRHLSSRLW